LNTTESHRFPSGQEQWQSGYLSHVTAELVNEFASVDPLHVFDAFNVALDEVPVAEGGASLLRRARQVLRTRLQEQADEPVAVFASS